MCMQALMRGFEVELTTSSKAYLKAARSHGDPSRLAAFFHSILQGALPWASALLMVAATA